MNDRLAPIFAGVVVAAVIGTALVGGRGGAGAAGGLLPLLLVGAGGLGLIRRFGGSGRTVVEGPWPASAAIIGGTTPVSREDASAWRIARALGRFEARALLSSGAFAVGIGFCVLLVGLFGIAWSPQNAGPWFDLAPQTPWFCLPLVGMTVVAAHRAVTRARRDRAVELLDTCPVPQTTRTLGFLLSAVTPVVVEVVFLTVLGTGIAVRSPFMYGSLEAADWMDIGSALLLGVGGVALGVLLGRWAAFALVPIVAVVAVAYANGAISGVGGHDWNPYNFLSTAPTIEWESPVFQARPALWHLLWIVGLTALVAAGALAHDSRGAGVRWLAVGAAVVTVLAGIGATRPMAPSSVERIARAIADPASTQECEQSGVLTVCVFPAHRPLLKRILEDTAPVVAALPPAAGPLTLRQRFHDELADLPPEVRRRLSERDLRAPAGEFPISFGEDFDYLLGNPAFHLALGAVSLPSRAGADLRPAVVAGQARGVVALWLATRGHNRADMRALTTSPNPHAVDAYDRGSNDEGGDCSVPSVIWSEQDLLAARAVVALPATAVAGVLEAEWARWIDPATGTDDLLAALGLAGVGPFDRVVARPGNPC